MEIGAALSAAELKPREPQLLHSGLEWVLAVATSILIALLLTAGVIGGGSILPEFLLDQDPVTRGSPAIRPRSYDDPTPVVLELGREWTIATSLHRGELPLWNPFNATGAPLWADQGSPFFPTKWIFYAFPGWATYQLSLAVRLIVAALGTFMLARLLGVSLRGALVAEGLFEASGTLAVFLPFNCASSIFMLPWLLAAAERLYLRTDRRGVSFAALALGAAALGGHPMLLLLVLMGFGAWVLARLPACASRRAALRYGLAACAAGALALFIAAAALLPFAELYMHALSYKTLAVGDSAWRIRLERMREMIQVSALFPSALLSMGPKLFWPWVNGASIGTTAVLLAIVGLRQLRERAPPLVLVVLAIGLGVAPPGLAWLHDLPGLGYILPFYPWCLLTLPVALLAGTAVDELARVRAWPIVAVLALVALVMAIHLLRTLPDALVSDDLRDRRHSIMEMLGMVGLLLGNWAAMLGAMAYTVGDMLAKRATAASLIGLLAVAEGVLEQAPVVATPRSERAEGKVDALNSTARALHAGLDMNTWRFTARPFGLAHPNSAALLTGLRDFRFCSPLPLARFRRILDLMGGPIGHTVLSPRAPSDRVLSLASVRYALGSAGPLSIDGIEYRALAEALPRARLVHRAHFVRDVADAERALATRITSDDWNESVVIEGHPFDLEAPDDPKMEHVTLLPSTRSEIVAVDLDVRTPALLVLSDAHYPGWRADVDGRSVDVLPADVLFRAVPVGPGHHRVTFRYEPWSVRLGLTLSGLALFSVLLMLRRWGRRG